MKRKKSRAGIYRAVLFVFFVGYFAGTSDVAAQRHEGQEAPNPLTTQQLQLSYPDYTNLIAGKPMPASLLEKYVNPMGWQQYASDMNQTWQRFAEKNLTPMRTWAIKELGAPQAVEGSVLYPFSGPDVANMMAFFPQAKTYIMIALEPVGTLPVFQPGKNEPFFSGLELAISELLQFNFFFTKMMEKDLIKRELDGVLPVLLFFLGRENVNIASISYWLMQQDGSISEKPVLAGEKLAGDGIPGVKIEFQRQDSGPKQTLYYFSFNLQNSFWRNHPKFVDFLKSFAPYHTFLKAASYLMFKPKFSDIRQFLLDQSQLVLQTDEGIPLKFFEPEKWDRRFFGKYSCPIQLFANCFQSDLAAMYQNGQNASPLPFGIGYHHRKNSSNLMIASRKVIVAKEAAK